MPTKKPAAKAGPRTLAVDVGGTGVKAAVLGPTGAMVTERERVSTPDPCPPEALVDAIAGLAEKLGAYDRISVGFPGVVRRGVVITAPHFGNDIWAGFTLAGTLTARLGRKTRLLNDAEVQGLGVIARRGLEVVLTLGTGLGSAVFNDGKLAPHLELAHHPIHKDKTYNDYVGNAAFQKQGRKRWNRRVRHMLDVVEVLLHYDRLYLGGGNAAHVSLDLPDTISITSNDAGITGGIHLWDEKIWAMGGVH